MWRIYEFPVQIHKYMYKNLVDQIQDWIRIEEGTWSQKNVIRL